MTRSSSAFTVSRGEFLGGRAFDQLTKEKVTAQCTDADEEAADVLACFLDVELEGNGFSRPS